MHTYLAIVTHPLLWAFLGLVAGFYLILWLASLDMRRMPRRSVWLRRNYPAVILTGVAVLAVVAMTFYLVEIGISVRVLVDRLRAAAADPDSAVGDLQSLASAVAILVGVLAAAATILYSSIRVWINERNATAAEEGLITDRINTAVQGLGAEKVVNRLGRTVRFTVDAVDGSYFEWQDNPGTPPPNPDVVDGKVKLTNDPWSSFPDTQPNLEVRIGAIYSLERIAQDSDRDHVQIMEILCAYVRQNAPAKLAESFPAEWHEALEAEWYIRNKPYFSEIWDWGGRLGRPREDIQVALAVIGRRSLRQIALEGHRNADGLWQGYRLDLRSTCLQGADLTAQRFENAILDGAVLSGARLIQTRLANASMRLAQLQAAGLAYSDLQDTDLSHVQLQGADLHGAQIQRATMWHAQLQRARFTEAQMQGAILREARMQGANLRRALLHAAYLGGTRMDKTTILSGAEFRGAAISGVDWSDVRLSEEKVNSIFGDGSVTLPNSVTPRNPNWPAHFPKESLEPTEFENAWRTWLRKTGFDAQDRVAV